MTTLRERLSFPAAGTVMAHNEAASDAYGSRAAVMSEDGPVGGYDGDPDRTMGVQPDDGGADGVTVAAAQAWLTANEEEVPPDWAALHEILD